MKNMRNLMILGVFILMAVSGFAQSREDGHRILKENGIEAKNDEDSKAINHGRCKTVFNTPNGIYITTTEWIEEYRTFKPVIYLYTDFNADFKNGKLTKVVDGFGIKSYSKTSNTMVIYSVVYSIGLYDSAQTGYMEKTDDLSTKTILKK